MRGLLPAAGGSSRRRELIPAAQGSSPLPGTRPRRGLRAGTCERPGRWRGPGSERGCDSVEMQPRSKGVRQLSFGGTGSGGRRRTGVPCTSPPGCCRDSPPGRSGRDRSGRSAALPSQSAPAGGDPRPSRLHVLPQGPEQPPRPGPTPSRVRRRRPGTARPRAPLPVLQPHQPQRNHMGHVQLRGPRAGGDAAEHAALLPDAQLLQLHGAGSTWWRGGPARSPGPAPAAPARCCRRRAQPTPRSARGSRWPAGRLPPSFTYGGATPQPRPAPPPPPAPPPLDSTVPATPRGAPGRGDVCPRGEGAGRRCHWPGGGPGCLHGTGG